MKEYWLKLSYTVVQEQDIWAKPDSLAFYKAHRNKPEDLYPSERFFLPDVLKEVSSCLDIGCAAGGFSHIMKHFNPNLNYMGIDIIPQFVKLAKKVYPDSEFCVGDGINLPFAFNSFELVFSTGVMHLNSHYEEIVRSAYAVCSKYLLCDFHLTKGPTIIGEFDVNFNGKSACRHPLPYIVVNEREFVEFLKRLEPKPIFIRAKGYYHRPSPMARITLKEVIMAFFLIKKSDENNKHTSIEVDINLSALPSEGENIEEWCQ